MKRTQLISILAIILLASCSDNKPIDHDIKHPSWQDNYYRYKTNIPNIPANKLFRLGFEEGDTALPFAQMKEVEIINANSTSLAHISLDIRNLTLLKSLNLTWTNLNYFPSVIFEMPQLVSLDFASRDKNLTIDTLVHNFKQLHNLELLSLISCNLDDLPIPISKLKKLKYLNLSMNKIFDITAPIENLDSLIELNLSQNELTVVPLGIEPLNNLEVLDLSNNNITSLSINLEKLKRLRVLNLSTNQNFNLTRSVAKEIKKDLKYLERIYLTNTNHSDKEIEELNKILPNKLVFYMRCGNI